jgi:TrmH family RNA methyltransferase
MKKSGQFVFFEGFHALEEALRANYLPEYILLRDENMLENSLFQNKFFIKNFANLKFLIVKEDIIKRLSSEKSPKGIISIGMIPEQKELGSFPWIYLDRIQDPGNLGTILRGSLAFGCGGVFLSEDSCSVYNSKVIRSSAGAIFKVPFRKENFNKIINEAKCDLTIFSFTPKATTPFFNYEFKERSLLVFGNEGKGISDAIIGASNKTVCIPTQSVESLNVAMSVNIVLSFLYFNNL